MKRFVPRASFTYCGRAVMSRRFYNLKMACSECLQVVPVTLRNVLPCVRFSSRLVEENWRKCDVRPCTCEVVLKSVSCGTLCTNSCWLVFCVSVSSNCIECRAAHGSPTHTHTAFENLLPWQPLHRHSRARAVLSGTPTLACDWPAGCSSATVIGYLLSLCHPPVLLSSHVIESPVRSFILLLPHHLSLLPLLLCVRERKRERVSHFNIFGWNNESLPVAKNHLMLLRKEIKGERTGNIARESKSD